MTSDYGMKIVRSGYSVHTAGVLDQVFNSSLNNMKTSERGIGSSTANGDRTILLSSLAYRCGFIAWFELAGSGTWYPCGTSVNGEYAACYVNSGSLLKADIHTNTNKAVRVKYILLVDPGE